jgi:hypothetical protein
MMKHLIEGAYDLHVHSGPDILPRKMDDVEMAQRIKESGMAGYAIKSHYFVTAERAKIINKLYPECEAIGTIALNNSVGGINPTAVEMAARAGAKLVWFPTSDSQHELSHVFDGNPNKKLPYWAQIIIQLREEGVNIPPIGILEENGKLKKEVYDVLSVIAKYDMILATGHCSHEETFELVKEAHSKGVKKIVITHVDFPTTFYTIDEQKKLASYGAFMEHCYTTFATGKVEIEVMIEQIRALGADRVILGTDLGQTTALYPDEGLLEFVKILNENGFSDEEIRKMTVYNNRYLLGK